MATINNVQGNTQQGIGDASHRDILVAIQDLVLAMGKLNDNVSNNQFDLTGAVASLISCSTTSVAVSLGSGAQVRLANFGGQAVNFKIGGSSALTSSQSDTAILPYTSEVFTIPSSISQRFLAASAFTGTSFLSITTGSGM